MQKSFVELNPVLSHAVVVNIPQPPPSGNLHLSATPQQRVQDFACLAESFNTNANRPTTQKDIDTFSLYSASVSFIVWRTCVQILEIQMDDYRRANSEEEKDLWKQRLLTSLIRCNEIAQKSNPALLQFDITPPTDSLVALNATGANWCYQLMKELTLLFMCACPADM